MTSKEYLRCLVSRAKIESGWQKERIITYKEEDKTNKEIDELANPILKDLEELEQYRKVMCKPILDLMKDLEMLEILKPYLKEVLEIKVYGDIIALNVLPHQFVSFQVDSNSHKEKYIKIKEWLEKNDL